MKLCEEFLAEMNLENASKENKTMACALLRAVIIEPMNQYDMFEQDSLADYYPDDISETQMKIMDICSYWFNDLSNILLESLKQDGVDTPLLDGNLLGKNIFKFLNARK